VFETQIEAVVQSSLNALNATEVIYLKWSISCYVSFTEINYFLNRHTHE
jgi:hypothetical protein